MVITVKVRLKVVVSVRCGRCGKYAAAGAFVCLFGCLGRKTYFCFRNTAKWA